MGCMQLLRPHFERAVALRADTLADLVRVSCSSLVLITSDWTIWQVAVSVRCDLTRRRLHQYSVQKKLVECWCPLLLWVRCWCICFCSMTPLLEVLFLCCVEGDMPIDEVRAGLWCWDNLTIFEEQCARGQVGIWPEKCQLNQIQNGRPSAIITFNMPDIWQTVPDS